jgi:hypothetical protein
LVTLFPDSLYLLPFSCFISTLSIPKIIHDALSDLKAMDLEMRALHQSETWELAPLISRKHSVGCKWVHTVKYLDGSVNCLKAQLVAKGYTQTYGVDYDETFSLVAKISSARVLVSLAANLDWPLYQLDVKNAFFS